ncbi:MAG: hypothetical protein GPJ54_01565 [Candidatus Heimdallarchaeota archaeon]|nr:hypothetical protein [Candidatus Heimdallarchaeota archaeon]
MISLDLFVVLSLLVIGFLVLLVAYTYVLYFRIKIIEFAIIASFFLFSGIFYSFVLLAYNYDKLIFYQLERFFLVSSYWFLLVLISKIKNTDKIFKALIRVLFLYSLAILSLIAFWEKGRQPDTATIFGGTIESIQNVPYHPEGASIRISSIDLIYGTSFPLLNTIFMILVSALLLYTFIIVELQVKTERTQRAKYLWIISLSFHLVWTILALPWLDLGRGFQFFNVISTVLIVIIIRFYPEGLILSKSQIMATYHFYDTLANLDSSKDEPSNISDMAIEYILDYIRSMPIEILDKPKELRKE